MRPLTIETYLRSAEPTQSIETSLIMAVGSTLIGVGTELWTRMGDIASEGDTLRTVKTVADDQQYHGHPILSPKVPIVAVTIQHESQSEKILPRSL